MGRKPRELMHGGIYHVFARGNDKQVIYFDDADRHVYLQKLARVVVDLRWRCLAYCLMNNHLHVLLETPEPNLSAGMQRVQSAYTKTFNSRHDRCGHVFQGRYGAVRVSADRQFRAVVAYIARNPVEAALCAAPEDWRWSSFACVLKSSEPDWLDTTRLFAHLGCDRADAVREYALLVHQPEPGNLNGV